jgi:hypothetical protein
MTSPPGTEDPHPGLTTFILFKTLEWFFQQRRDPGSLLCATERGTIDVLLDYDAKTPC